MRCQPQQSPGKDNQASRGYLNQKGVTMSEPPRSIAMATLEHIGPWVRSLGGLIAGFIARAYNGIRREMKRHLTT